MSVNPGFVSLGEAHWVKPSSWEPLQPSVWVIWHQEVLAKSLELTSHNKTEEFGKGQKETPHVRLPLRILLPGIHLGWATWVLPERTLSHDRPKTAQKLILSPWNPRLWALWQSHSPGLPYATALHPGALPNKTSCFVSSCVSFNNSFLSVR